MHQPEICPENWTAIKVVNLIYSENQDIISVRKFGQLPFAAFIPKGSKARI